ncbi:hypothetical protein K439DRAFT_537159 [Ramaria rubella]|nr:hypothetical protein K439DRAFT_537159 [Ramaria rubella]
MSADALISHHLSNPHVERSSIDPAVLAELSTVIKGTLYSIGEENFELHSKLFNGDVISRASLLVRPFDAQDVSEIVKFCLRQSLSLSVKAGGYGTHGHAVQGDVIVDVSLLNDITIERINDQGGFTSIKDMPSLKNLSKSREVNCDLTLEATRALAHAEDSFLSFGKRRAGEAFEVDESMDQGYSGVPSYPLLAPPSTAGSGSFSFQRGAPQPKIRRTDPTTDTGPGPASVTSHGDTPRDPLCVSRQLSSSSNSSGNSSGLRSSHSGSGVSFPGQGHESVSTDPTSVGSDTSKSPPSQVDPFGYMSTSSTSQDLGVSKSPPSQSDPFGYLSDPPAGGASSLPMPTFEPPAVFANPFAQPSSGLFSSEGHYMPTRVTPTYPHAYVTFGAGAKQKEIDVYSSSHPLPATSIEGTPCFTPYHVPFSAHPVGSSVMLLGGFGFLSRLHGLSIDNLVEVEMVLVDGSIVVVNEDDHPDLWWALRGAGPAFGIVTRYKAKAYPVPVVFAGNLLYKFRRSTAASLIKHFRDCVKNVPRELYANVILTAGPDGDALLVIQICYLGCQEQGVEFLQAITSWDGEQCLLNEVSEKSFLNQQDSLAQLINGKAGRKWFIRSDLLNTLTDETVHETVMRFADTPIGCTWLFELSGGNVSDEHGGCFPAAVRQGTWTVAAFHQWELHEDDPRCVTSAEDWMRDALGPVSTGGSFPSFFGIHETGKRVQGSFGENWKRLCEIKRKYDPEGFFKHNFWPLDKDEQPRTSVVPTRTEF